MRRLPFRSATSFVRHVALVCALLLLPGNTLLYASPQEQANSAQNTTEQTEQQEAPKVPNDQLDSLVAPIALYPDPLISQVLVASTYPLEIIQLQQWLAKNKDLKGDALAQAVKKQDWDASIQALAAFPDVVKQLAENIKWTTDLGNAFLAQQGDVMDAVQRMRKKAKDEGNLKTTEQQKVETKVVEKKEVVVIQPSSPEVIYVPSYNPTVVYGPPVYPYPPIYYPPPGYYAAGMAISFGVGMAMGAAWGGGGWGWGCSWGHNDITVNRNNTFVSNSNRANVNRSARGGNTWQHNPQHRGGAPYSNRNVANRYGGTARGDSMATRQQSATRQQARQQAGAATGGAGGTQRAAMERTAGSGDASNRAAAGSGERAASRDFSGAESRNTSAFGGAGSGTSGSAARASSQRGASSFSGRSGGGGSRGGGRRR